MRSHTTRRTRWNVNATAPLTMIAAIALSLTPASAPAALVGYYEFESNLNTSVGAVNATASGSPTAGTPGGIVGNAVELETETNDNVKVALGFGSAQPLGQNFTVSAWYNLNASPAANASSRYFVYEAQTTFDVSYGIRNSSLGRAGINDGDVNVQGATPASFQIADAGLTGWHHIVQTYTVVSTTTTVRTYIDGVLQGTTPTIAAASILDAAGLNFGAARTSVTDRGFDGLIDEVALFNHAMSTVEAQRLYQHQLVGNSLLEVGPGVLAARVAVGGTTDPTTTYGVSNESAGFGGVSFQANNLGDHQLHVAPGAVRLLQADGVIMANANHIGHASGDDHIIEVGGDLTQPGADPRYNNGMAFAQADQSAGTEKNFNFSFAHFKFSEGWVGGHVDGVSPAAAFLSTNVDTLPAGSTVTKLNSAVSTIGPGSYVLHLEGVDSREDGMLFAIGGENDNNVLSVGVFRDPTNVHVLSGDAQLGDWHIHSRDRANNDTSDVGEDGDWSFVYIPYAVNPDGKQITNLIGGEIAANGTTLLNSVGAFTATKGGTGIYEIQISDGIGGYFSDQDGVLILSTSSILEALGSGNNFDPVDGNTLNWYFDVGTQKFIVESRDAPAGDLQDLAGTGGFVFAFISYTTPPSLIAVVPTPAAMPAGLAMLGLLTVRRRRR